MPIQPLPLQKPFRPSLSWSAKPSWSASHEPSGFSGDFDELAASKQVWLSLDHIGVFRDQYRGAVALRLVTYVNEQQDLNAPVEVSDYSYRMLRDTLENWQSEFLQLIWQVAGLAILLYVGSPQSREGDERKEAKLDAILEAVDKDGRKTVAALDRKFHRA